MKKFINALVLAAAAVLALGIIASCAPAQKEAPKAAVKEAPKEKQIKAGFVYVGPVGDYGFTNAHDVGRKYVEGKFPWLKTVIVESVPEGDSSRIIDRLINEEKCDVVFTCSFGYMDDTIKAGERFPDKLFMHCSGFKQSKNVGTYFAELYEMYYLNGLMAGALTKSNKIGYVGAFPISEVVRHIDAYALGVKAANPKAKVYVRWINSWYDPAKAKEAAEALVAEGVDNLAFTEDSPAVIEVGQAHMKKGKQVYTYSHYSPMQKFGPDSAVSGQLVDWGVQYEKILGDIQKGTWSNADLWWRAAEGAAMLGGEMGVPVNPKFIDQLKAIKIKTTDLGELNAYDLVMKRYDQIKKKEFEPFTGPIAAQDKSVKIKSGDKATKDQLITIDYFVDNVVGAIPKK